MVLVLLAWSGCGPGRSIHLVNGYECYVDDAFIMVSRPDGLGDSICDVGELDFVKDWVFGTRVEIFTSEPITGYFLLDTKKQKVELFQIEKEWLSRLDEHGLTNQNVRWPGVFFRGLGWRMKLLGWACPVLSFIAIGFWIRGILRTRRDMFGLL